MFNIISLIFIYVYTHLCRAIHDCTLLCVHMHAVLYFYVRYGVHQLVQGQSDRLGEELSPCKQRAATTQALPGPATDDCHRPTP